MTMSKIIVFGSINIDNVVYTRNLPQPGVTVEGDSFISNIGGKGANQACATHFLGSDVTFFGSVGKDDNGRRVKEFFDSIKLPYFLIESEKSTGTAMIIIDENTAENRILCVPGANFDVKKSDIDKMLPMINKGDIFLTQLESDQETIVYAIKKAKKKGAIVVLNPAPARRNLPNAVYPNIDFFIPNEHEIDTYAPAICSYEEKARMLIDKGVKNVVITLGENGSLLVNKDMSKLIAPHKVKAIDTTAAGDSYCGALVNALSEGKDIISALEFASKCSSITVTRKGAINSLPHKEDLQ